MESVYLETTFVSYLVARPSRDLLVAAHQQITQDWWANRRGEFACSVSQVVIDEASVREGVSAFAAITGTMVAMLVSKTTRSGHFWSE